FLDGTGPRKGPICSRQNFPSYQVNALSPCSHVWLEVTHTTHSCLGPLVKATACPASREPPIRLSSAPRHPTRQSTYHILRAQLHRPLLSPSLSDQGPQRRITPREAYPLLFPWKRTTCPNRSTG